ncbi:putative small GTPase, P-loop containing nucleoside triphosphate hydrolase [Helianthus annuus]|nr:putative small GTPase, P-loop containing nucleoside triphosphate hydrolase [Helianthus annuus]
MDVSSVSEFDYLFKLLMIADLGVGKSSVLLSFTSDTFEELSPTIGFMFLLLGLEEGERKCRIRERRVAQIGYWYTSVSFLVLGLSMMPAH